MIEPLLAVIAICLVAVYLYSYMNRQLYLMKTRQCPTCQGYGRINQVETWAGTTMGDPCPTCHEKGRIAL